MKLSKAYFCINCEEIFEGANVCPACTSTMIVPLTKFIPPIGIQKDPACEHQSTTVVGLYLVCDQCGQSLGFYSPEEDFTPI